MPKSRATGGTVYVAAPKPSKWLTLAPSLIALIATVGGAAVAGLLTYNATTSASTDRRVDAQRLERQTAYTKLLTDVNQLGNLARRAASDLQATPPNASAFNIDSAVVLDYLATIDSDVALIEIVGSTVASVAASNIQSDASEVGGLTTAYGTCGSSLLDSKSSTCVDTKKLLDDATTRLVKDKVAFIVIAQVDVGNSPITRPLTAVPT